MNLEEKNKFINRYGLKNFKLLCYLRSNDVYIWVIAVVMGVHRRTIERWIKRIWG